MIYELHVGTFTPEGTFAGAGGAARRPGRPRHHRDRADAAGGLSGRRNWGYDGVLLFAPESTTAQPEELKSFVDAAHQLGMMVLLDVVYNHFGPEGNYLHLFAPSILHRPTEDTMGRRHQLRRTGQRRRAGFVVHNARYWLDEFHFDGLRLDAVHAIFDDSEQHIVSELAAVVRRHSAGRHVHLILENDHNEARYLRRAIRMAGL